MKKSLLFFATCSLIAIGANAQFGSTTQTPSAPAGPLVKSLPVLEPTTAMAQNQEVKTNSSSRLANNNPSVQFSGDVIIKTDTVNQRNVKVATAFNGWIYAAWTLNHVGYGGVQVRRSKDGGINWYNFVSYDFAGANFPAVDIAVAGNDTNNLFVFLAGVNQTVSTGACVAWIDKFNGATGAFISEAFNESSPYLMRDIAIATDYRHPSWVSAPFSVGVVYSKASPYDSVIYNASLNGGTTYTNRQKIYATPAFCDKVAIGYGIGASFSNGRYFLAFESKASPSYNDGHVLFTHTTSDPSSTFQPPIYLDSIGGVVTNFNNRLGHPRIACSNDGLDNTSGNITAVVFVGRSYSSADHDVLPLFSNASVYSTLANWNIDYYMANSGLYETGGDVAYNEMSRTFCGTYYDSTQQHITADSIGLNIPATPTWTYINTQYNDLTTNVSLPFPRVSVNPVSGTPNFVWNSEGASGKGISLFDAMTIIPLGIPVATSTNDFTTPYPNPSNGIVNFNYTLKSNEHVELSILNILGQNVIPTIDFGTQNAGEYHVPLNFSSLPNGVYVYRFVSGKEMKTGNLVIAQ